MPDAKAIVLIVNDALSIRMALGQVLPRNGYTSRSAPLISPVVESAQTHRIWADTLKMSWGRQMNAQRL